MVVPQANPDGRHHSMTIDAMWRKNRRPAGAGDPGCTTGGGNGPGVDVNRNYDFLWDCPNKFNSQAAVVTSTDPCDATFRGPSAASEPETMNVVWLMNRFPRLAFFIDVHSFGEDILYNWGTTTTRAPSRRRTSTIRRSTPPAACWATRRQGDVQRYREYIPATDRDTLIWLGIVMRDAIQAAHGRSYTVKPAVDLYPTCGTSDDYGYSRCYTDPTKSRMLGYTIEWGPQHPSIPESFHPATPTWPPSSRKSPLDCWPSVWP